MKKSKFLHNPKDMLSKSFNPAKCKTALKLAASRMKLMKNKKEVQVKQMKRELAGLLESGQDQTARIRVEHVIREEKMMAAYDLIGIYCELIVARLPMIESQKNCPIDLKEAVTSIIFASPRCGDIPELLDARKHFTAKYGKDFVTPAIELRPNCGVSRLLVEKLSANAPDGQTKIKALRAIAEEHNIKWDPESFGQSDALPSDDLLNGPSTFEKFSAVHAEARPHVTPDIQAPPSHHMMDNQPVNFPEQNLRSQETQKLASRDNTLSSNRVSSVPQGQMRPSGDGADMGEVSLSFQKERNSYSTRQSWEMEFKDATSAAQAAAESAERASMAARAAAELSSLGRGATQPQYPSEVRSSAGDARRDERTAKHGSSKYKSDNLPRDPANSSFSNRQPRFQNRPMDGIEHDNGRFSGNSYGDGHDYGKIYAHSASSRSTASYKIDTAAHSVQMPPDGNHHRSLSNEEENKVQSSMQKQSGKSQIEGMNHSQEGFSSENLDYSREGRINKQSSVLSSSSHSSVSSSDEKYSISGHNMFDYDAGKEFSVDIDQEKNARDTVQPSYHASAAPVVFDDSGSDTEDFVFDKGFRIDEESNYQFAPLGRNSPPRLSNSKGNESLESKTTKSLESSISEFSTKKHSFPESSESLEAPVDGSQADNFGPATFDDSDGANSESEIDMLHSVHHATVDYGDLLTEKSSSLGFSDIERHRSDYYRTETAVDSSQKFGFGDSPTSQSSFRLGKSHRESINAGSKYDNVKLHDSDGANSENEIDMLYSGHHGTVYSQDLSTERNKSPRFSNAEKHRNDSYRAETVVESSQKFGFGDSPASQISTGLGESRQEPTVVGSKSSFYNSVDGVGNLGASGSKSSLVHEVEDNVGVSHSHGRQMDDESSDGSMGLSLKKLTGGLRQKGYMRPPYTRSQVDDTSSSAGRVSEANPNMIPQPAAYITTESLANKGKNEGVGSGRSSRLSNYHSDSESDSSVEELRKQPASRRQDPNIQHPGNKDRKQSSLRSSVTYFDSDSSDSEDDSAQVFTGRSHLGSGISRRTKASPSSSTLVSNLKGGSNSRMQVNPDSSVERNPKRHYYGVETPQESRTRTRNSDQQADSQQPSSAKVVSNPSFMSSIPLPEENKSSSRVEQLPSSEQKVDTSRSRTRHSDQPGNSEQPSSAKVASNPSLVSKVSLPEEKRKSSGLEQPKSSERKLETSDSTENQKTASGSAFSREDSLKKASHVHPKLPDYDTLAAKFQALRTNRQ
ncbi:uncharacterized protein [Coffea arabica]|uniref:Uncharacterized protein isoform X2 n=1 Tax=Coffea arabica TaxID=13443 RepID=A0A6P6SWA7_COFAR|nr:uncharacterized protein LOC113695447 isoform X1 [Coffea arabica]